MISTAAITEPVSWSGCGLQCPNYFIYKDSESDDPKIDEMRFRTCSSVVAYLPPRRTETS